MTKQTIPRAERLILTRPDNPRAAVPEMMSEYVSGDFAVTTESSPARAIQLAFDQTPAHGLICVTGSLYLIGEIQQALRQTQDMQITRANSPG